jgi:hypothetical protein
MLIWYCHEPPWSPHRPLPRADSGALQRGCSQRRPPPCLRHLFRSPPPCKLTHDPSVYLAWTHTWRLVHAAASNRRGVTRGGPWVGAWFVQDRASRTPGRPRSAVHSGAPPRDHCTCPALRHPVSSPATRQSTLPELTRGASYMRLHRSAGSEAWWAVGWGVVRTGTGLSHTPPPSFSCLQRSPPP